MNLFYIALIIVILAILGFNIFDYLSKATEVTAKETELLGKDILKTGELIGETSLGVVEGGVIGGVESARSVLHRELDISPNEKIEKARNSIRLTSYQPKREHIARGKAMHQDAADIYDMRKSGYCLIGSDEQTGQPRRACVRVGPNDKCSSNQIYPSMAVCVNPSLRA